MSVDAPSSFIYQPASYVEILALEGLFHCHRPLEVELGSGDGSFLVKYAQMHPDRNFIGVERLLGRIRKIDKKTQRAGLDNIQLVRIEARYMLEFMLPRQSVHILHIYFPDPWPKRKHRKNRLITDRLVDIASKTLVPGGVVYMRTDDLDYFSQMNSVFTANQAFYWVETDPDLKQVTTDFELDFNERGISTLHAAFKLKAALQVKRRCHEPVE
jgi:tRNA (guanine-N7-)-methyltransferase